MTDTAMTQAHAETTRLESHEIVRRLSAHLGPTLVATLSNIRDRKLPHRWARADGPEPRPDSLERLIAAHQAWMLLSTAETDHIARTWFIGANPRLNDQAPVSALREGDVQQVLAAARAFVDGTDN